MTCLVVQNDTGFYYVNVLPEIKLPLDHAQAALEQAYFKNK